MQSSLYTLVALGALSLPALAGDLFVGPGQPFTQIQQAIDAASPGDRVFVAPGNYLSFELNKAIEVRGAGVAETFVRNFSFPSTTKVSGIPAGAVATISSMVFTHEDINIQSQPLVRVSDNAGTVVFHHVHIATLTFAQPWNSPTVRATDTHRLILQRCEVRGFGGSPFGGIGHPALRATNTSLEISRSRLVAGQNSPGHNTFVEDSGPPALLVVGGDVRLARVQAQGGGGTFDSFSFLPLPGGAGVELRDAELIVSGGPDNELEGGKGSSNGSASSAGGAGIRLVGNSSVQYAPDAVLVGGRDGAGTTQAAPVQVEAGASAVPLAQNLMSLALEPQTASLGANVVFEFDGEPAALTFTLVSTGLGPKLALDGITGVVHLDTALGSFLPTFALDANGRYLAGATVPGLPALAGAHVWLQAVQLAGAEVSVSNPVRLAIAP